MKLDSRLLLAAAAVAGIALAAVSGMSGDSVAEDGTAGAATTTPEASASALPEGHPEIPPTASAGETLVGVVRETLQGGGYTYARLDTDDGEVWAAGPTTDLAEGETVTLMGVMQMGAFSSPSLERSFDELYFVDRFVAGDASEATGAGGAAAPDAVVGDFRGTVKQAIPASRYVYLEVETGDGPVWLAAPEMAVEEGDEVRWAGGTLMRDFASGTLDRTFDAILFVGQLAVVED